MLGKLQIRANLDEVLLRFKFLAVVIPPVVTTNNQ